MLLERANLHLAVAFRHLNNKIKSNKYGLPLTNEISGYVYGSAINMVGSSSNSLNFFCVAAILSFSSLVSTGLNDRDDEKMVDNLQC